jgi:hypothetical protein
MCPFGEAIEDAEALNVPLLCPSGEAIEEADAVIDARPDWFEGYVRRAEALTSYEKYTDAHKDYCKALDRCPTNKERVRAFM